MLKQTTTKMVIFLLALTCILSALTGNAYSQSYLSIFGDSSTTWDIILYGYCDAICSQTVVVTNDTTVGSNTYKVISGLPGFVREDTVQGKAWFYDTYYNTEYLVMDLGLNLGDTFNIYDFSNMAFPFIVDSVYFVNSLKHVRLDAWTTMCALNEKITFIEGSGTTASFSYQRDLNGNFVSSYMLCHHKNGVSVAGNILFNDACYICDVGGIDESSSYSISLKIFPNPFSFSTTLESNEHFKNAIFTIHSVTGQKVKKINNFSGQKIKLYRDNLQSGIYFIRLTQDNNSIMTGKLIIVD